MRFDDLDNRMRVFETAHDFMVLPGIYMVARIDGRGFTKLTKEVMKFERPFDPKFRDLMIDTVKHLMGCGFRVVYGYTQSDEISLLFHPEEETFNRKTRKYNSVLAGEASASFSLSAGSLATFDCRVSELPNPELVTDYFNWRMEDASRNCLNSYCYWTMRDKGINPEKASEKLMKMSVADKNELLFSYGINFNDLPAWQKRGTGIYWHKTEKEGFNPLKNIKEKTIRKVLKVDYDLPMREEYTMMVKQFL